VARSAGNGKGVFSGVPFGAKGPPYFRAGLRISPDFFRMSLALYGDGTMVDDEEDVSRGTMPVKSSFRPFSRFRWDMWGEDNVGNDISDLARTGCRRGIKLPGDVAGPATVVEDEAVEGVDDMIGAMGAGGDAERSGDG
jgi:hypothetical protein